VTNAACPITSADGWMLCSLPVGHEGPHDMRSVAIGDLTKPSTIPARDVAMSTLRLRMKVWTDRATEKRYLMPTAFFRDVVDGRPVSDVMCAYAMRDDDTKLITVREMEWNALPYHYFKEDGEAPRAAVRPVDVVTMMRGKTS